jgi:hypothetical protein
MWLFFVPMDIHNLCATENTRYAREDFVSPEEEAAAPAADEHRASSSDDECADDEGEGGEGGAPATKKRRRTLTPCGKRDTGARHRFKETKKNKWTEKSGYSFLVFWAILLAKSALGLRYAEQMWSEKYSTRVPWVQNAMTRNSFRQHREYLHFADNSKLPKYGTKRWSPLQKVCRAIGIIQKKIRSGWTAGVKVCVDESMIKYMGKAISWVQYMPNKPIKHGIKVFALCCAYTGFMMAFEIYTGAREEVDGSKTAIINRLLESGCDFTKHSMRVMYTDNFYTSLEVMQMLHEKYKMLMCGTHKLTAKKSRTADEFPWHKLTPKALRSVGRGWLRRATQAFTYKDPVDNKEYKYVAQAIVWKDRKQVAFLSNNNVGKVQETERVRRYSKPHRRKIKINCHSVTKDYQKHMSGVDRKDRDLADWGITVRTNRYYNRLIFFAIDSSTHCAYVCVKFIAEGFGKGHRWHKYTSKQDGRWRFQLDLAQALIGYAINEVWDWETKESKPAWMRSHDWVPCDCGTCCFCARSLTRGVAHKPTGKARSTPSSKEAKHTWWPASRATIGKRTDCTPCVRERAANKGVGKVGKTDLGCPGCGIAVCTRHWSEYGHDATKK